MIPEPDPMLAGNVEKLVIFIEIFSFGVSSQSGDRTNIVIGLMLYILTPNSESAQDNHN